MFENEEDKLVSAELKVPQTHEVKILDKMKERNKNCVDFFQKKYIYDQNENYKQGI